MNRYTQANSEKELHSPVGLNHLCRAYFVGFLWSIILLCLVLSQYLVYLRVLPHVHVHLLAKKDSSKEAYM